MSKTSSQAVSAGATMNQDQTQCLDYGCLGPDYETIDSRRQSQRKHQVQAGLLSERYEYSEAHLATDGGASGPEASADYEVPLKQNVGTEDLKH